MRLERTLLSDGQLPTVAFPMLAQLSGPYANRIETSAALFTKIGNGRTSNPSVLAALITMCELPPNLIFAQSSFSLSQVSFVSSSGGAISKSIAIDDISFLGNVCNQVTTRKYVL